VVARPLSRAHLEDDLRAVNSSIDLIQRTRGGTWPEGPVSEDSNFVDLVWHEQEFRERSSFSYAAYETAGAYLGCCYLYPMGLRTELTGDLIAHDVDASWWVTQDAYERGYYEKLHRALCQWIAEEFPFEAPYFSNVDIPREPVV
jgi:RimJ/RimL family protein N-acetyltransferase